MLRVTPEVCLSDCSHFSLSSLPFHMTLTTHDNLLLNRLNMFLI